MNMMTKVSLMSIEAISDYDEAYPYKGYVLVNDLYEDDEGFYKNSWEYGVVEGTQVFEVKELTGLSSNSYANFSEAYKKFCLLVDELISN